MTRGREKNHDSTARTRLIRGFFGLYESVKLNMVVSAASFDSRALHLYLCVYLSLTAFPSQEVGDFFRTNIFSKIFLKEISARARACSCTHFLPSRERGDYINNQEINFTEQNDLKRLKNVLKTFLERF